jgi:hypothetical protein
MRELASREGLDLGASFAYSDSESDLPMLQAVGHAVVVNPDGPLRRIAAEHGWEVIELDRLGRRLKMVAALGAGTALASAGRLLLERGGVQRTGERVQRTGQRFARGRAEPARRTRARPQRRAGSGSRRRGEATASQRRRS